MGQADLVVCVGYDLVEWSPVAWNPNRDRRIICIDTVAAEIDEHYVPDVELTGDIAHILTHLGNLISDKPPARLPAPPYRDAAARRARARARDDGFPIKPQRVLRDLRELMGARRPADLRRRRAQAVDLAAVADPRAEHRADLQRRGGDGLRRRRRAVAARLVLPRDRRVVTISGDGGFLMNFQELETAKRLGLAIVNLVWTDSAYGVIEMHQSASSAAWPAPSSRTPTGSPWPSRSGSPACGSGSADEVDAHAAQRALALDVSSVVEIPIDYRENTTLLAAPCRLRQGRGRSGLDGNDDRGCPQDPGRRRVVRDRRDPRRALAVRRQRRGAGRIRRRRRRPPRDRRGREGDEDARAGARAGGGPRPAGGDPPRPPRRVRAHHRPGGRQAAHDGAGRGRPGRADGPVLRRRGPLAGRRGDRDGRASRRAAATPGS